MANTYQTYMPNLLAAVEYGNEPCVILLVTLKHMKIIIDQHE